MAIRTERHELQVSTPGDREIRTEREFAAPRTMVWRAHTEPELVARWWGRGNRVDIERFEPQTGGHWRFTEHHEGGSDTFGGRMREVTPQERIVQTFEWEGMPGHVIVNHSSFEELPNGRTRIVTISQFHTPEERDGMLHSGMAEGQGQSYAALDELLATLAA